ncbi:MAG: hypothetical protein FWC77_01645 [Defluviitaleaceae bacterium]|nr:hypothetical protein [Defluviitaleaceae bacterium]
MPFWHSVAASVIVCAFVTVGIGNTCYAKPLDEDYKDLRRKIKTMTKKELIALLSEHLPENEHKAVFYCDFESKGVNYVADSILFCSPRTVSNYRRAGYEKLKRLYNQN